MKRRLAGEILPLLLFLTGAAATVALLALFAYAPAVRNATSSGSDALSRSAVGYAGLNRLLQLSGIATEIDRGMAPGQSARPSLTILTPLPGISREEWRDYQERGAVLVILPKWITLPLPLNSAWVMKEGALYPSAVTGMIASLARVVVTQQPGDFRNLILERGAKLQGVPPALTTSIQQLQTISPGNARGPAARAGARTVTVNIVPLLRDEPVQAPLLVQGYRKDGQALGLSAVLVRVRGGEKPVYILSEPDLMNNLGLANETTAKAALAIIRSLRQGNGPVRFDVTLNGLGHEPNLLQALFEPPFRGATIAAFLAALMVGMHALARFGAPQRPAEAYVRSKKALADNSAALVRMMGREGGMAWRYIQAARDMALARLGARRRSPAEQQALISVLEGRTGGSEYATLVAAAGDAKSGSDLLRIAGQAYAWRRRISGEHQRD